MYSLKTSRMKKQIIAYASANGITATKHVSGLYYEIMWIMEVALRLRMRVTVEYINRSSNTFDQIRAILQMLHQLIEGWQNRIPLIKKKGVRIRLNHSIITCLWL